MFNKTISLITFKILIELSLKNYYEIYPLMKKKISTVEKIPKC